MSAKVAKSLEELEIALSAARSAIPPVPIILVPTMGALHAGHETLIRAAVELAGPTGKVVVSVFVNPLQFGPSEDFNRYPRGLSRDAAIASSAGATHIFAPAPEEFTPRDLSTSVDPGPLADALCGPFRPGHFRGVCTIVLKLFNAVRPTHAIFGWKDAQQFVILRKMVTDLNLPIEMIGVETVREADGLAMSSRNAYLSPGERRQAPALFRTLQELKEALLCGAIIPSDAEAFAQERLTASGIHSVDYVQLVSADTLRPGDATITPEDRSRTNREFLLAAAVRIGATRLIDNIRF